MVLYRTILCLSFTLVFILVSLVLIVFGYETKTILWNHGIGKKHVRALDLLAHYGHVMMNKNKIYTYKKSDYFFFFFFYSVFSLLCCNRDFAAVFVCSFAGCGQPEKKPEQMDSWLFDKNCRILHFRLKWTSLGINTQISAIKLHPTSGFESI